MARYIDIEIQKRWSSEVPAFLGLTLIWSAKTDET